MRTHLLDSRQGFAGDDLIFTLNAAAQQRAATGAPVINATVGALLDDHGKLVVLDSVMALWRELTPMEIAPYAPIAGDPAFLLALTQRHWPQLTSPGVAVATPGGSGALALTRENALVLVAVIAAWIAIAAPAARVGRARARALFVAGGGIER